MQLCGLVVSVTQHLKCIPQIWKYLAAFQCLTKALQSISLKFKQEQQETSGKAQQKAGAHLGKCRRSVWTPPIYAKQPDHSHVIMNLSQLLFLMTNIEHHNWQDAAIKPLPEKNITCATRQQIAGPYRSFPLALKFLTYIIRLYK